LRKFLIGVSLGLGAAGLVLLASLAGLLDTVELDLYDWRMRTVAVDPPDVSPEIVLVEINDTTLRDMEPWAGRWPWPRVAISLLIDFLNRAPARVVAVDIGFLEKDRVVMHRLGEDGRISGEDSDAALAASVRQAGNVILLANAANEGVIGGEEENKPGEWGGAPYRLGPAVEERRAILPPLPALTDAAAGLGHNFLPIDTDGPARRMPPFIRSGDHYMPSLGVAAALKGANVMPEDVVLEQHAIRIGTRVVPLVSGRVRNVDDQSQTHDQLTMLINYRAPVFRKEGGRPYTSYEARHLFKSEGQMQSGEKPLVDPAVFKDKIVFIGLTASGLLDVFQTPFGKQGLMPGIQLHASMADSILSNRFIRPAPASRRMAVTVAGAVVVGLLAAFLPFAGAAPAALVVMCGFAYYSVGAFRAGQWVNLAEPVSAMAVALFAGTAYQYFVEGSQKRVVKKLFGRYVSKDVYDQLIAHPERAELGGARREMSVLFSDIRGFTTITEKGEPEALVAQLNEYFSRMVDIVFRRQGTVDKFVGDMVMALFGAPLDDPRHAEHAVAAAVDMVRELGELNRKWAAEGRAQLDIGIGVNTGEMIAGNIGSSSIMSYTVIGDNVNLGSRLESANKDYKTRIIISDATRAGLSGAYDVRPLGEVIVKGKTRPVAIFEVRVPSPMRDAET
jgi:adenylate cyclase